MSNEYNKNEDNDKDEKVKKKKTVIKIEDDASPKDIAKKLDDIYGGFTIAEGGEYPPVDRITSGIPELDDILGGGYVKGSLVEIFGPESSGKTWILTKTYAANQKLGKVCVHYDLETTYAMEFAKACGVDLETLVYKQPEGEDYAEKVLEQVESICKTGKVDIIGIDSTAAMIPKDSFFGSYEDKEMAPLARVLSKVLPRLAPVARATGTTILFINQLRTKIGQFSAYGEPTDTPGGKAFKFFASMRIEVKKSMPDKDSYPELYGEEGEPIGHIMKCKVIKNKTAPPFRKCETILRYRPLPPNQEIVFNALQEDIIAKNKSNHKKLSYKGVTFEIEEKNNYDQIWNSLKENGLAVDLIRESGLESRIGNFIAAGFLTQEESEMKPKAIEETKPTEKKKKKDE